MNTKTTAALFIAAAAAAAAAWYFVGISPSARTQEPSANTPLFDGLLARVNDVASVTISTKEGTFTLVKDAAGWKCTEKGGYPVQPSMVKEAVVGLAMLHDAEPKTQSAALYEKIGVQDVVPAAPAAGTPDTETPPETVATGPTQVTLKSGAGEVIASAVVGNSRPGNRPTVFVRKTGEPQSWLAQGNVPAPARSTLWLEADILSVPREKVMKVTVTQPDGSSVIASRHAPSEPQLAVENVPAGRELTNNYVVDPLASALGYLRLDDVAPLEQIDFTGGPDGMSGVPGATFESRTFDGLIVTARTVLKDGKTWAAFTAAVDDESARAQAEATVAREQADEAAARAEAAAKAAADPALPTAPVTPAPGVDQPPKPADQNTPPPAEGQAPPSGPTPEETAKRIQTLIDEVHKEAETMNAKVSKWAYQLSEYSAKTISTKMESLLKPVAAPTDGGPVGPTPVGPDNAPVDMPAPQPPGSPE